MFAQQYPERGTSLGAFFIVVAVMAMLGSLLVGSIVHMTPGRRIHPPTLDKSMEVPLPPLSNHAIEGHAEALLIRTWINKNGRYCCFSCRDGRSRCGCKIPILGYCIAVFTGDITITAYRTTQGQVKSITGGDLCDNPFSMLPGH